MQLETPALLQQNLARVPRTLPTPILSKGLIIQNVVQRRPRERSRDCSQYSKGQRQKHVDESHSIDGGELMD